MKMTTLKPVRYSESNTKKSLQWSMPAAEKERDL